MNPSAPRIPAALDAAIQRVKVAAREAAQRCVDALGVAALAAVKTSEREDLLAAQFDLNRKQSAFGMTFNERLDEAVGHEVRRLEGVTTRGASRMGTGWQSLSLVDDREVELQVSAERIALTLQHECEWDLRELDTLMFGLLKPIASPDVELRNPLRPEIIGKSLVAGCNVVTDRPSAARALAEQMAKTLASAMPALYGTIVQEFKATGVKPPDLAVKTTHGPGNDLSQFTNTGYDSTSRAASLDGEDSGPGRLGPSSSRAGLGSTQSGIINAATTIGSVDAEVMKVIRQIAMLGNAAIESNAAAGVAGAGGLTNLIVAHREDLQRTATGALDHMVIDVVGSLFDQILADPKVAPQMARHIARLQLPVLRAALGDPTFFSSRRHPVRKLVNRIASLGVAFDDFTSEAAQHFLKLLQQLVEEIVNGDFDQMQVYEQTLDKLESFVADQAKHEVESKSQATSLLDNKETELLLQQRYMQQLQAAFAPVPLEDFLRQFLTQVWSQALMRAAALEGPNGERVQRYRATGRELVMSVQPKSRPADRKQFLTRLPQLMKDLNEGIALIGWPESAKKDFFAKLLPAHAASLKVTESMRTLDYNLLARQLDAVLATPLPKPEEAIRGMSAIPVLDDVVADPFTAEEAQRIGLVQEHAIDWSGEVDIDLSAGEEPEVSAVDIQLEGLPTPEPVEPTKGASLADHVQIGFSYRMHFEGQWHKVRLSHISPGRTFFVFTRGKEHQHAISMTARMLVRLCETGRLRAFENAYLLERATARARKQLAALKPSGAKSVSGVPMTRY